MFEIFDHVYSDLKGEIAFTFTHCFRAAADADSNIVRAHVCDALKVTQDEGNEVRGHRRSLLEARD